MLTLEEQQKLWDEKQAGIQQEVSNWLKRCIECDFNEAGIQISMDECVHWEDAGRGKWAIAIPWALNRKLAEIEYQPQLPFCEKTWRGETSDESRISTRLFAVARMIYDSPGLCGCGEPSGAFVARVANAYGELKRCYYTLPGLKHATPNQRDNNPQPHLFDHWVNKLEAARCAKEHEVTWAIETVLKGIPKRISSFYVDPQYSLMKPNGDYVRVVEVIGMTGHEWIVEAEAADYKSPEKLRELLNRRAGGSWLAGSNEFQLAIEDWGPVLDSKRVELVTEIGWHSPIPTSELGRPVQPAGAWFFADGAIDSEGKVCLPDKLGLISVKCPTEKGHMFRKFKVSSRDESGQKEFFLGRPELGFKKGPKGGACPLDPTVVADLWTEVSQRCFDVIGSFDAFAAMGLTMAYAAAPEIFQQHGCFPGLWLNGEARHGKSTFAAWLGRFFGVTRSCSVSDSTGPGTEGVLQQFSNLPPILDEAQTIMKDSVLSMLKNAFNRIPPAKQTEHLRRVLTMPIVAGIATSESAQLRSRYLHVTVAKSNRLPKAGTIDLGGPNPGSVFSPETVDQLQSENYGWLESHRDQFRNFGRFALEKRPGKNGFVAQVMNRLTGFLNAPDTSGLDSRAKIVHGVAFAGYLAMCDVLGVAMPVGCEDLFRKHLIERTREAMSSTDQAGELDHFWRTLCQAFGLGVFGNSYDHSTRYPEGHVWRNFFKFEAVNHLKGTPFTDPGSPQNDMSWVSYDLIIRYDRVMPMLTKFLRERNETLKLREADIEKQASTKPYWRPVKRGAKVKFEKGAAFGDHRFWRISLDHFDEFGFRKISDEEFLAWKDENATGGVPDPREGMLYSIIRALERGKREENQTDEL